MLLLSQQHECGVIGPTRAPRRGGVRARPSRYGVGDGNRDFGGVPAASRGLCLDRQSHSRVPRAGGRRGAGRDAALGRRAAFGRNPLGGLYRAYGPQPRHRPSAAAQPRTAALRPSRRGPGSRGSGGRNAGGGRCLAPGPAAGQRSDRAAAGANRHGVPAAPGRRRATERDRGADGRLTRAGVRPRAPGSSPLPRRA
jgi:hypothetical protein